MSLVPYERLPDRAPSLETAARFAEAVARTEFVPETLRGNPAAIAAAILYGDEVGIPPMQSLAKIAVINGRPTLAAEAQRALILRAGHDLWIEESTTTKCTVAGRRKESEYVSRITWTLDDAKRANIAGKQPWRQYPRQMLLARATAELARAVFADAIGGLAATEEAVEDGDVEVIEAEPTTRRRRQRASVTQPPTTTVLDAPPERREVPPLPGEDVPPAEATAVEAEAGDVPESTPLDVPGSAMSDAQRRLLMALFRENGFEGREHRLAWSTVQVGRHITTSNELTSDEASLLIDRLQELARVVE